MTTAAEWSLGFDLFWNNLMSNQAPGVEEYEKGVLLTRAQDDIVKDYFSGKTNNLGEGFDDSERRQSDFSTLVETVKLDSASAPSGDVAPLYKGNELKYYKYPSNVFIVLNEVASATAGGTTTFYTVVPVSFAEYARLTKKPYKYPPKGQAWRLITSSGGSGENAYKRIELIARFPANSSVDYTVRYVRRPKPIVLENQEEPQLGADGVVTVQTPVCELPEQLHDEILYRAVNLAKVMWTDPSNIQQTK